MAVNAPVVSPATIEKIDEWVEGNAERDDKTGWYCVATRPFPCPGEGCGFVANHMTAAHLIIVWPREDDRHLLSYAADAKKLGRDPMVIEYERAMGPCISFDAWIAAGAPVHGLNPRPEGIEFKKL